MKCNVYLNRLVHYSYFGCPTIIIMFYFLIFESHFNVKIVEINNVVVVVVVVVVVEIWIKYFSFS